MYTLGCKRFIKVEARRLGRSVVHIYTMLYCVVHEVNTIFIILLSVNSNKLLNVEFLHKLNMWIYIVCAHFADDIRENRRRRIQEYNSTDIVLIIIPSQHFKKRRH